MKDFELFESGSPTTVPGFMATGVTAGFKRSGAPDFALVYSDKPANFAGVFTSCTFAAAPVLYCRELVKNSPYLQAFAINSGNANACTGIAGVEAAKRSAEMVAEKLQIPANFVAVASTGRIGVQLPMDLIKRGINLAVPTLSSEGGNIAAQAIMTTDTLPKSAAVKVEINGKIVTIGGMTKGAGMIDPHLATPHATMICTLTTDVEADNATLQQILQSCADDSFNRITVDGDMSTNDTVLLFANGRSGIKITTGSIEAECFKKGLLLLMQNLARRMVMDGEGSTKFVTVEVIHAKTKNDAKIAAEAVGNSLLCKTAWFGNDPNWGRVVAALGYSGATFNPDKCDIYFGGIPVVRAGGDAGTPEKDLLKVVKEREFVITCDFNEGDEDFWVWSSDISYEYVKINADYHT